MVRRGIFKMVRCRMNPRKSITIGTVTAFGLMFLLYRNNSNRNCKYRGDCILYENWDFTEKIDHPPFPVQRDVNVSVQEVDDDITLITAYYDIGCFQKGEQMSGGAVNIQGKELYKTWMTNFEVLDNYVILFTDSTDIADYFRSVRQNISTQKTRIIRVNRDEFHGFQIAPKIKEIYSQTGYPQFYPNTVNENYSSSMHAKYDAIEFVIERKLFRTKYLAWIDIGYLRDARQHIVKMKVPSNLKDDHISFLQVKQFIEHVSPEKIISDNMIWIGGGIFVGKPEYLMIFIEDYRRALKWLLSKRLMSTDQQVLYILYSKESKLKPRIPLQTYYHPCRCNWFYLGKLMLGEYEVRVSTIPNLVIEKSQKEDMSVYLTKYIK